MGLQFSQSKGHLIMPNAVRKALLQVNHVKLSKPFLLPASNSWSRSVTRDTINFLQCHKFLKKNWWYKVDNFAFISAITFCCAQFATITHWHRVTIQVIWEMKTVTFRLITFYTLFIQILPLEVRCLYILTCNERCQNCLSSHKSLQFPLVAER